MMTIVRRDWLLAIGGWICLSTIGCAPAIKAPGDDKLRVAVSIVPQSWLVRKIGGDHVVVSCLSKPGEDPHTYSPTDAEVSELMRSKVYFRIGIEFERGNWFEAIKKSDSLLMVDVREGIELREGEVCNHPHHHHDHAHGHGHDHGHHHHHHEHGQDPHIWLAPELIRTQAQTVAKTLAEIDPDHRDVYMANLAALEKELEETDEYIREKLEPLKGKAFFVFHPAWGYFADAYDMRQIAVETGGKEPSDKELTDIQRQARQEGVKVVFVQPTVPGRSPQAVAQAIGGRTELLDDLAENIIENLRLAADRISKSYE